MGDRFIRSNFSIKGHTVRTQNLQSCLKTSNMPPIKVEERMLSGRQLELSSHINRPRGRKLLF